MRDGDRELGGTVDLGLDAQRVLDDAREFVGVACRVVRQMVAREPVAEDLLWSRSEVRDNGA